LQVSTGHVVIDAVVDEIVNNICRRALDKEANYCAGGVVCLQEIDAVVDEIVDYGCGFALDKDADGLCTKVR
jgi:hypothetical protein